jgi:hypothetical protein
MEFIIHVGFSKTGTTTLQNQLFSNHSQIYYLGKPYHEPQFKNEIIDMVRSETIAYNDRLLKGWFAKKMDEAGKSGKKIAMISEEILTSGTKARDKGVVAQRIQEVFAPSKVIFSIRNQFDLLKSAYFGSMRFVKNVPEKFQGLTIPFEDALEISCKNHFISYIGHADFFKTIDYYSKLFGKKSIYVHVFEEFVADKQNCMKKLTDFLGIDCHEAMTLIAGKHENKRISQAQFNYDRVKSRLFPFHRSLPIRVFLKLYNRVNCHPWGQRKAEITYSPEWKTKIWNYYCEGNRMLSKEFNIPLDKYGYPL